MKNHFRKLYKHLAWADARVLQSLRAAHAVLKKDLDLYSHILGSEHVWLSRIRGVPTQVAVWPSLTLDECERLAGENAAAFNGVISALTEEGRETRITVVRLPHRSAQPATSRVRQTTSLLPAGRPRQRAKDRRRLVYGESRLDLQSPKRPSDH